WVTRPRRSSSAGTVSRAPTMHGQPYSLASSAMWAPRVPSVETTAAMLPSSGPRVVPPPASWTRITGGTHSGESSSSIAASTSAGPRTSRTSASTASPNAVAVPLPTSSQSLISARDLGQLRRSLLGERHELDRADAAPLRAFQLDDRAVVPVNPAGVARVAEFDREHRLDDAGDLDDLPVGAVQLQRDGARLGRHRVVRRR